MYVCICRAVTEHEVKSAIEAGAKTVQAVTQACCAGDDCGACHATIEDMIEGRWGAAADGAVHLPLVKEGVTERERAA
jgi:bacterioferritin-associated ferredoxin